MPQALAAAAIQFVIQLAIRKGTEYFRNDLRAKWKRDKLNTVPQNVMYSYSGGLTPRRILYGNFRAGGLELMPASVSAPSARCMQRAISD
jgi:hypothetical protein